MKKQLVSIFVFLLLLCVLSFIAGWSLGFSAPFYLSAVSLALFGAIYFLEILGYEIGGSHITIRKRLNDLEQQNTELKESVTALLKSIYVLSHYDSPVAGPSIEQHALLDEYLRPINHLIAGDIRSQVDIDVLKAHENGRHFRNP